jgi:hypothetical protein
MALMLQLHDDSTVIVSLPKQCKPHMLQQNPPTQTAVCIATAADATLAQLHCKL